VKGERVMGMCDYGAMSTMVMADTDLLWHVPEHWTLEEAATIPVVYGTVS
jgi:fatty acid synthase